MSKYFLICSEENKTSLPSAFMKGDPPMDHELIEDLEGYNELPFELEIVNLSVGKNGLIKSQDLSTIEEIWLDYLPNSLAWGLASEKLRETIEKCLTRNEGFDWIAAKVNGNQEQKLYYVPRFNKKLDVLDFEKTLFVKGTDHIIKPCFSLSKIQNLSMFVKPSAYNLWKITSELYVSEFVKKAIENAKLTGLDFESVSAV